MDLKNKFSLTLMTLISKLNGFKFILVLYYTLYALDGTVYYVYMSYFIL